MERGEIVNRYLQVLQIHHREKNLDFLHDLMQHHVANFAFSSVGCQLGDDLPLDLDAIFQRIVLKRRGGYCFEQNGLFFEVLSELKFSPTLILGRVVLNQDIYPGLTHRFSVITIMEQQYLLDVGFGYLGPSLPVPMSGAVCSDGRRSFRILERTPGEFHLQVLQDGSFFSLYRFEMARYGQADCEIGHFFSHRHPDATFVNHLVVSRIEKKRTLSLIDLHYRIMSQSGTWEREIVDANDLARVLVDELGVRVSTDESRYLYEKAMDRE